MRFKKQKIGSEDRFTSYINLYKIKTNILGIQKKANFKMKKKKLKI